MLITFPLQDESFYFTHQCSNGGYLKQGSQVPAGAGPSNSPQLIPWGEKVLEARRWRVEKSGENVCGSSEHFKTGLGDVIFGDPGQ